MAISDLCSTVVALVETSKKHVSHAMRRLRLRPGRKRKDGGGNGGAVGRCLGRPGCSSIPFVGDRRIVAEEDDKKKRKKSKISGQGATSEEGGEAGVWQRRILMGEKCRPLDFSGVIHYDSSGKQVAEYPTPPPPSASLRTLIHSFAFLEGEQEEDEVIH